MGKAHDLETCSFYVSKDALTVSMPGGKCFGMLFTVPAPLSFLIYSKGTIAIPSFMLDVADNDSWGSMLPYEQTVLIIHPSRLPNALAP